MKYKREPGKKYDFKTELRICRKERGLTQTTCANLSGISMMTIRRYENGLAFPSPKNFSKLVLVLPQESLKKAWVKESPLGKDAELLCSVDITRQASFNVITQIIKAEDDNFTEALSQAASLFQRMTPDGILACLEYLRLIAKMPEYKRVPKIQKDAVSTKEKDSKEENNP